MPLSNAERQAKHRQRRKAAEAKIDSIIAIANAVIDRAEAFIARSINAGIQPNDGSKEGKILSDEIEWLEENRKQVAALSSDRNGFYNPN